MRPTVLFSRRHLLSAAVVATSFAAASCGEKKPGDESAPPPEGGAAAGSQLPSAAGLSGPVTLRRPSLDVGSTIKTTTKMSAPEGKLSTVVGGEETSGSIALSRDRVFEATVGRREADAVVALRLTVVGDVTSTRLNFGDVQRSDDAPSSLVGIPLAGRKDGDDWEFTLAGGVEPKEEQIEALAEYSAYYSSRWFPGHPVSPGDSWEFDPAFINHLIARDVPVVRGEGEMTLKEIRSEGGRRIADIAVQIRSGGSGNLASGEGRGAVDVNLDGTMTVDLATGLDVELALSGSIVSSASTGDTASLELPVTVVTEKEILQR